MIRKQNMNNVAYTKEYMQEFEKVSNYVFKEEYFISEVKEEISHNISRVIKKYYYKSLSNEYPYNISGTENNIFKDDILIYTYNCINDDAEFCELINHSNGDDYLIFRRDLYGYSVLFLATMEDFHYIPFESFSQAGGEAFIWCNVFYNKNNNMLAIKGCYWACPDGVMLADFKNPMAETRQIDLSEFILTYEALDLYDSDILDFKWIGNDFSIDCNIYNSTSQDYRIKNIFVKEAEYKNWLIKGL